MSGDIVNLEKILACWQEQYGTEKVGQKHGNTYYEIPIGQRVELLTHLVDSLREAGCDESFFLRGSVINQIVTACSPPIWFNDKSRANRVDATKKDLMRAVGRVWPHEIKEAQLADRKPTTKAIVKESSGSAATEYELYDRELDRSIFRDVPEPEVVYDPEMAKMLGIKHE